MILKKLKKWLKMDYQGIKERYEKLLADSDKPYKQAMQKIETALVSSPVELNQPAIVKSDPTIIYPIYLPMTAMHLARYASNPIPAISGNCLNHPRNSFTWN